ncbi:MAG: ribosomal protein S18-alanine N-acetyltransferase [Eubacteriales bacterium]|nr:ribosomal protein S18-alanine N-acetyltransferase [Eubacteriales bacterium]
MILDGFELIRLDERSCTDELLRQIAGIDESIFPGNPWGTESLAGSAKADYDHLTAVVGTEGGRAAAFGLIRCFDDAEVIRIAVEPDKRRRGLGSIILADMLGEAAKRGITNIFLEVRSANTPAIELYKKAGFVTEGVRRGYYHEPKDDALIMRYTC